MSNDRKQRIMQHLGLTTDIKFKRSTRNSEPSQKLEPSVPKPEPTPPPVKIQPPVQTQPTSAENRKQRIMQHLSQSGTNFNLSSRDREKRKQQVQAHISKTRG
ncbi:MAG: hypothetical protein AAFW70_14240 [Cyanobacteria bacterium J06635_10]